MTSSKFFLNSSLILHLFSDEQRRLAGRAVLTSLTMVTPLCRQSVVDEVPDVS